MSEVLQVTEKDTLHYFTDVKGNDGNLSQEHVFCNVSVPIALAVIIVLIYKLYKYWKWRQQREILVGEREPLLPGSRPSSRIQEPVYTGL